MDEQEFNRIAFAAIHAIPVLNPNIEPVYVTSKDIEYRAAPYGPICTIPQGTSVIPATNLPEGDKFWAEPWEGMDDQVDSWFRNYGFMIDSDDVELNA